MSSEGYIYIMAKKMKENKQNGRLVANSHRPPAHITRVFGSLLAFSLEGSRIERG